ncbi:unnamed protein product [Nesidiocoris tenuis]|uniref:Calreticulin n=1 Tax=Nesidiocoris tenuis TaxID=355587 RepID=A0A6H5GF91_9HEMI|nr:unnamed protein product [Nesidiocoris tenuis]
MPGYKPHFRESFNDPDVFAMKWVKSEAKKAGTEEDVAQYNGDWELGYPKKLPIEGDQALVFRQKAKHRAISAKLNRPFVFSDKPLYLQYEVLFQDNQECGGAYLKLLSEGPQGEKLKEFHDKTPYTIMFGPDKCGNSAKLHFIFRKEIPINGEIVEHHSKGPSKRIDEFFSDGQSHLYTLVLQPDNTYQILVDHEIIIKGSLLEDFTPPVNPPAEIDDPEDHKPEDWDERERIPDEAATKPDDWDENAPRQIQDPNAVKPDNWLDNEPLDIMDPSAEKPEDWDDAMDGEWEGPMVPNPACEDAAGCGPWSPPMIDNPAYKGKWSPPMINNPNYQGKWHPKRIANPDFFEDKNPFNMTTVVSLGFELWSMSANIMFDNIVLTDNEEYIRKWSSATFDRKMEINNRNADQDPTAKSGDDSSQPLLKESDGGDGEGNYDNDEDDEGEEDDDDETRSRAADELENEVNETMDGVRQRLTTPSSSSEVQNMVNEQIDSEDASNSSSSAADRQKSD